MLAGAKLKEAITKEEEEKANAKKIAAANAKRRAWFPQRPKEPLQHWKTKTAEALSAPRITKDDQQDVILDPYAPRLPQGWFQWQEMEMNSRLVEINENVPMHHGLPIDPELL